MYTIYQYRIFQAAKMGMLDIQLKHMQKSNAK